MYIILSLITFYKVKASEIRKIAKKEDVSRSIIFVIILLSSLVSLFAIISLIMRQQDKNSILVLEMAVYLLGVFLSWTLLHTTFTLRYAHLYYGDNRKDETLHAGGLTIPNELLPDYLDFAYFSFVIGMTYQVSDISITSKRIRRQVLLHSLLSFLFNTVIIAISINAIMNLDKLR